MNRTDLIKVQCNNHGQLFAQDASSTKRLSYVVPASNEPTNSPVLSVMMVLVCSLFFNVHSPHLDHSLDIRPPEFQLLRLIDRSDEPVRWIPRNLETNAPLRARTDGIPFGRNTLNDHRCITHAHIHGGALERGLQGRVSGQYHVFRNIYMPEMPSLQDHGILIRY